MGDADPFEVRTRKAMRRKDNIGRLDLMAHARGWAMVRRPGCIPFVMDVRDWMALPEWRPLPPPPSADDAVTACNRSEP